MSFMIACLTQKGGPGKSTVARTAAVAYAMAGWDTVILDTDTDQNTATRWMARRADHPTASCENLRVEAAKGVNPLRSVLQSDPDLIVIDGCPHATSQTADFAGSADLILIPTGTAIDDLNPAANLAAQLVRAHGVKPERIRFVLNHVGPRGKGVAVAKELLEESTGCKVLANYLTERPSYRNALDDGKVPQECSHHIVKAEALRVVEDIVNALDEVSSND